MHMRETLKLIGSGVGIEQYLWQLNEKLGANDVLLLKSSTEKCKEM